MKVPDSIKERLRAEGRWGAFVKRRDALKKSGLAADEAYEQALAEFTTPPEGTGWRQDIAEAAVWAWNNLSNENVTLQDAPSPHAWFFRDAIREKLMRDDEDTLGQLMDAQEAAESDAAVQGSEAQPVAK